MIDNDNFTRIVTDIQNNVFLNPDDATLLVQSIAELDAHLYIAQETLSHTLDTAVKLMEDIATACVKSVGIRDKGKERKLMKIAAETAAKFTTSVQMFVAGQIIAANSILQEETPTSESEENTNE